MFFINYRYKNLFSKTIPSEGVNYSGFLIKFNPFVVILLCASLLFYKYLLSILPSVMLHDLMAVFHLNGMQVGNLAAFFFYTYTVMQMFSGVILDRFGIRLVAVIATLVSALGCLLFASSKQLYLAEIARGMMGLGVSFATVTYLKITSIAVNKKYTALVGGLLATSMMLGSLFGKVFLSLLLQKTNWKFSVYFCAGVGMVIAILFFIIVRKDMPYTPIKKNGCIQRVQWKIIHSALIKKQNLLLALYSGLSFSPLAVFGGLWGDPFIQAVYHLSRTKTAMLVSLSFIGFGIGAPIFGFFSDRFCKYLLIMQAGTLLALLSLSISIYFSPLPIWLLGSFLFLFGTGVGAFMLVFVIAKNKNEKLLYASIIALINTGGSIFESFTEPLIGKLLDLTWQGKIVDGSRYFSLLDYRYAFSLLPFYLIGAIILLSFIKEPAALVPRSTR